MFLRVAKKFKEIGLKNSILVAKNKFNNFFSYKSLKKKSCQKLDFLIEEFCQKFEIKEFDKFFETLCKKDLDFATSYLKDFEYLKSEIFSQAQDILNDYHEVLGFGKLKKTSWFEDVTVIDGFFDNLSFYKDIKIESSPDEILHKDIKVPWHFSRFHHATILGIAYQTTGQQKYLEKAREEIEDWIEKNPYLIGINWLCPMEVAIRALNWIYFFYFFKDSKEMSLDFWKKFISILYFHLIYLENNWEFYDSKTNNHYLSDLLGYFYLCHFFSQKNKLHWCFKEFLKEVDKQIFDEGTSYEGSTSYHNLVTEIYCHYLLIAQQVNLEIPCKYLDKFEAMKNFAKSCKLIKIGDNDSGQIILGLSQFSNHQSEKKLFYKDFGLSIFEDKNFHLTLRHCAYKKNQPSGHFHNDISSITLSLNEIPIIIDPGSYVYTASSCWRNHFRSVYLHNTFFVESLEPVQLSNNLFYLNLKEGCDDKNFESNNFYYQDLHAKRKIDFFENEILIYDQWINLTKKTKKIVSCWNFTLAPEIYLEKSDGWNIIYKDQILAKLKSDLKFEIEEVFCSSKYGQKEKCLRLFAREEICLTPLGNESFKSLITILYNPSIHLSF